MGLLRCARNDGKAERFVVPPRNDGGNIEQGILNEE
jgi:hypothetical protein